MCERYQAFCIRPPTPQFWGTLSKSRVESPPELGDLGGGSGSNYHFSNIFSRLELDLNRLGLLGDLEKSDRLHQIAQLFVVVVAGIKRRRKLVELRTKLP